MKCDKLGISVAFLSALAFFFGWYSLTIAAIITVGVICVSKNETLRRNVLNAFILSLIFTIISLVLGKISSGYMNFIGKLLSWDFVKFFNYDVYNVFAKFDLSRYILSVLGFVEFVLMVIFVIISFRGKAVKVPGVNALVNKVMSAKEGTVKEENPVTSEKETLTEIPR